VISKRKNSKRFFKKTRNPSKIQSEEKENSSFIDTIPGQLSKDLGIESIT
jgi:hypothetical protein